MVKTKICPVCAKSLVSKNALRQHVQAKHGNGAAAAPAMPRSGASARRARAPRSRPGAKSQGRVESGVDILDTTTFKANALPGAVLFALTLSVVELAGTRLAAVAGLWSRWRPRSLTLQIVPSAGSTASGSYIVGWSADPDYLLSSGDSAIRTVAAMVPSAQRHISSPMSFKIPCDSLQKWYLVRGSVDGETSHGALFGVLAAAIGNLTSDSSVSFSMRLHWTIEFQNPRLPEKEEMETIYAEDDYTPYFTDSISDWASGTKLTLKAKEGGSAVPFPGAQSGVVYKLDSKAKLPFMDRAVNRYITHGVRIPNYHSAALAVFNDAAKAKKFAETGDSAYCLDYVTAGGWCTPNNPAWSLVTSVTLHQDPAFRALSNQYREMAERVAQLTSQLERLTAGSSQDFVVLGPDLVDS